jgi:hypothetical protein
MYQLQDFFVDDPGQVASGTVASVGNGAGPNYRLVFFKPLQKFERSAQAAS